MIVAAHQPAYLPWLGYFDKVVRADVFVVMDDLQYEAQNFQNRNRIKMNGGAAWLTVPLQRGSQRDRICDKRICNAAAGTREDWRLRTFASLRTHYGRSPWFRRYAPALEELYAREWTSLVELDLCLFERALAWLGWDPPRWVRSSTLGLSGRKTERILELCRRLGADVYLSGAGASRTYLDVDLLASGGVRVAWQHFRHPVYPQRYPTLGFIPNLCVLDLLFNCGPESGRVLRGAVEKEAA